MVFYLVEYLVDYVSIFYLLDPLSFLMSKAVVSSATPPPIMYGKYSLSSSSDIFTLFYNRDMS